jgi:hypothetical protein
MATVKRLLAAEGSSDASAEAYGAAAAAVYDKLDAELSRLLGSAGFQALFARSAKLAQREFACLSEVAVAEGSTKLRACLQALDAVTAAQAAEALFGTFFALLATFIGERLTTQALRNAWPAIEARGEGT